jgi:3-methyladenine DNA glycosylase AlkD
MPPKKKTARSAVAKTSKPAPGKQPPLPDQVADILATLKRLGNQRTRDDMAKRYNITGPSAEKAFGVPMSAIKTAGKKLGRNHELALALWETGNYEARMLCSFIDDPAQVTPAQMDRWVRTFDNWAYCDALCFNLFDRTPYAFDKVSQWATSKDEFVKRTAFALLWSLALHDKASADKPFTACLPLIEKAATDERNFVKKAVRMVLCAVGRRSPALNTACTSLARRLAASTDPTARWIGKDSLKDLNKTGKTKP